MRRLLLFALLIAALFAMPAAASASGLQLNGSSGFADAGVDPTADQNTTARTWEAWIKTSDTTGNRAIFNHHRNTLNTQSFSFAVIDGHVNMYIQSGSASSNRRGATLVADGNWHHVAAVWVPGSRLDVYVDGQPDNALPDESVLTSIDIAATTTLRIGVSHYQGANFGYFNGGLDGLRYSLDARYAPNQTFEPEECPEADTNTIGVWNFEDTTASQGLITSSATLQPGAGFGDGFGCGGGDALRFDGDDDRVDAATDPSAASNTTARTWEAWVKTTSNERQTILGRFPGTGEAPWILDMEDGIARIHVQNGSAHGARYASETVNDGEWHHLAAVWVPGTRLDLYIDGEKSNGPLGGGGVPASIAVAAGAPMRIGAGQDDDDRGADDFFDGDLDSVRYSKAARYDEDFAPQECWAADADTVALWTFDEGDGTTAASTGQLDEDADLIGGVRWVTGLGCDPDAPETGGSALLLNGANQYAEAGTDPTADSNTTARTWEAWLKTSSTAGNQAVINRYRHASGSGPWGLTIYGGKPLVYLQNGGSSSSRFGTTLVNDGQWHHVAAVWVPGSRLDVYIDGQLANGALDGSILSQVDLAGDVTIRIGVSHYGGSLYVPFTGALDGIRYSSGARYSGAFTPDIHPDADAGTIGLWSFDEGSGTSAAVSGQMTAAATLTNGASWTTGPTL